MPLSVCFSPAGKLGGPTCKPQKRAVCEFRELVDCFYRPQLCAQAGRSYSQTNAPKPSLGTNVHNASRAPVNAQGIAETRPREDGDNLTRICQSKRDMHETQLSTPEYPSPPGAWGNSPDGTSSGSGGASMITSSPLRDAALTTIVGLALGRHVNCAFGFNYFYRELARMLVRHPPKA